MTAYSNFRKAMTSLSIALAVWLAGVTLQAQVLQGHITLGDSLPAQFATVFVPATGLGIVTDQDGHYWLEDMPRGNVEVEYSFLGYRTVRRTLVIDEARTYVHDEQLEEQPIALGDVYVTPNGEDPAVYILRHVAERAEANRSRLQHYEAQMDFLLHAQDVDFLPAVMPKAAHWVIRSILKARHRCALYDYCSAQERADVRLSTYMVYDHGRRQYQDKQVQSATPSIPDKAREQVFQMADADPFDRLYGNDTDYGKKALRRGRCPFKLKGSFEENGQVIDVLEATTQDDDGGRIVTTLYVIEDVWGIKRLCREDDSQHERIECRDVGGGIYMPVSRVMDPSFSNVKIDALINDFKTNCEAKTERGETLDSEDRDMLERVERFFQKRSMPRPTITTGYSISYSKVQLAR